MHQKHPFQARNLSDDETKTLVGLSDLIKENARTKGPDAEIAFEEDDDGRPAAAVPSSDEEDGEEIPFAFPGDSTDPDAASPTRKKIVRPGVRLHPAILTSSVFDVLCMLAKLGRRLLNHQLCCHNLCFSTAG